jgi:hypothetical protein
LLARAPENILLKDHLLLLVALREWYTGEKFDALKQLDILKNAEPSTGAYFSKIIGGLVFKEKAYQQAIPFLLTAHQNIDQEALLYLAVAYLETNQRNEAEKILIGLSESDLPDIRQVAKNLTSLILPEAKKEKENWDDALKYQYLHFNRERLSEQEMLQIAEEINNKNIKLLTAAELMEYYLQKQETDKAEDIYEDTQVSSKAENYFIGEFNLQYLNLLLAQKKFGLLSKTLDWVYVNDYAKSRLLYFRARIADAKGNDELAGEMYRQAVEKNLFQPEVYVYAARFYKKKGEKDTAYEILVDGLELLPESIMLMKDYIIIATELKLYQYAADIMGRLKTALPASDFAAFKDKYEKLIKESRN